MKTDLKTVKEVCELTGLKRRQLYDYDKMGILKPNDRENEAGYKLYDENSIRKLLQIALWREIGIPQKQILEIMTDPNCSLEIVLERHMEMLEKDRQHVDDMLLITGYLRDMQRMRASLDVQTQQDSFDMQTQQASLDMQTLYGFEPGIDLFSARTAEGIAKEIRAKVRQMEEEET